MRYLSWPDWEPLHGFISRQRDHSATVTYCSAHPFTIFRAFPIADCFQSYRPDGIYGHLISAYLSSCIPELGSKSCKVCRLALFTLRIIVLCDTQARWALEGLEKTIDDAPANSQATIPANCLDRAYVIVSGRVENPVLIPGEYLESLGPACLHVCITATESSYVGLNQLASARRVQNNGESYAACYPTTWERTTSSFVSISRETITPVRSSRRLQATSKIPQAPDDVWR